MIHTVVVGRTPDAVARASGVASYDEMPDGWAGVTTTEEALTVASMMLPSTTRIMHLDDEDSAPELADFVRASIALTEI